VVFASVEEQTLGHDLLYEFAEAFKKLDGAV